MKFLHPVLEQAPGPWSESGFAVWVRLAPQPCLQDLPGVLQRMIEVDDWDGPGKTEPAHVSQSGGPIDEPHHWQSRRQATARCRRPPAGAKLFDRPKLDTQVVDW